MAETIGQQLAREIGEIWPWRMDKAKERVVAARIDEAVEEARRDGGCPCPACVAHREARRKSAGYVPPDEQSARAITPRVGDYVLATKYQDGDPCDHFFVGFVSAIFADGRYLVVDAEGVPQRANGFRRAECITKDEGERLVALFSDISDKPGPSLWWHLEQIRQTQPRR